MQFTGTGCKTKFNMNNQSQFPGYVLSSKGLPITALNFTPSADNSYIGVYAQYSNNPAWTPLGIELPYQPTLQQVRDVNRNIMLNSGSYENAHFYLRSAEGNNVTTAFYTNEDGGAIQSGDTDSFTALNLQPLGGLLTYGGNEVATKSWVSTQGFLTSIAGTANRITVSGNTINIAANYAGQNTITTLGTVTTGTWNGATIDVSRGGTGQTSIGTDGQTLRSNGTTWAMADALTFGGVIPASANLNTYQTTGIYVQDTNANAASGTNYPVGLAGKLEVVRYISFVWQTYHQYPGSGDRSIYKREYYAGTWSAWVKVSDSNNISTLAIQNQNTSAQTANFWISGNGKIDTNLSVAGTASVGVANPTTFNASATLFPGLTPKAEIMTGSASSVAYNEGLVIRHAYHDSTVADRNVGVIFKLSTEASAGESAKAAAIMLGSSSTFANNPNLKFYIGNSAAPVFQLQNDGTALFNSLVATGAGYVKVSSTGVLSRSNTIPLSDITGYSTPTLQQVLTAGNSASTSISLTGGSNGTSLYLDAAAANYTIRGSNTTGWARGLIFYDNAGTTILNQIGLNASLSTMTYGYFGLAYNNAILKWTNNSVGIGFPSTNTPSKTLHVLNSSTTESTISRFESFDGYVDMRNAGFSGSVMTPMIFGKGAYQSAYGLMIRGSGLSGYSAAAVHISGTNATNDGAVTSGNILAVNNYTTNLLAMDYLGALTMPSYGGLQGTSMVTTNNNGTFSRKVVRTASTNNAATANVYGKIATITLPTQYNDANIVIDASISGAGIATQGNSKVLIRAKQQAAFGNDPLIEMIQLNHNATTPTSYYQFWYVIVQNTPTTIVDIYVKIIGTYVGVECNIWDYNNPAIQYYNQATLAASITGTGTPVQFIQNNYSTQEWTTSNFIKQNGNSYGAPIVIGTNDNNAVYVKVNNVQVVSIDQNGLLGGAGIKNYATGNNALISTLATGTFISRNIADGNTTLTVNQANSSSTGDIVNFQRNGSTFAKVTNAGYIQAFRLGANTTGANPSYLLDINAGTAATAQTLASFAQNTGSVTIGNGTGNASQFYPILTASNFGRSDVGFHIQAQGSNGYTTAAFALVAKNSGGNGAVTSGNLFQLLNNATAVMSIDYLGNTTHVGQLYVKAPAATPGQYAIHTELGTGGNGNLLFYKNSSGDTSISTWGVWNTANTRWEYQATTTVGLTRMEFKIDGSIRFYNTPSASVTSGNAVTYNNPLTIGGNGTLTLSSMAGTGTRIVTADSSGNLSSLSALTASNGGTGATSLTGVIIGNGTSAMTAVTGTANQLLRRNAANTGYEFFTANYLTTTPTLQDVATAGNSFNGDILLGIAGSELYVGSTAIGDGNTRLGRSTLTTLTNGNWNTAIGSEALKNLSTGVNNTAVGEIALLNLMSGSSNTAVGDSAGLGVTGGDNNIYFGLAAGVVQNGNRARGNINTFIGRNAGRYDIAGTTTLGSYNIALGLSAGQNKTDASNQLFIGNYDATLFPQHIIEGVMGTSQALTFNADVTISTLAGSGARMVVADASGALSTQTIGSMVSQWIDNTVTSYNYLSANDPYLGGGKGIYSNGGYASNYQELVAQYGSIDDNVEFAYRINTTNSDWTLYLPDPSLFPSRVINITNFSTDTNSGIIFDGSYLPMNTDNGLAIDYLSSVKGDPSLPQWIQIMSIYTTVSGTTAYYWMVTKAGRKTGF